MSGNDNYNIDDFWPGAEELLDQHFQKKKGFGKRAGFISVAFILISCLAAFLFTDVFQSMQHANAPITPNKISTGIVAPSAASNSGSSSETTAAAALSPVEQSNDILPNATTSTTQSQPKNLPKQSTGNVPSENILAYKTESEKAISNHSAALKSVDNSKSRTSPNTSLHSEINPSLTASKTPATKQVEPLNNSDINTKSHSSEKSVVSSISKSVNQSTETTQSTAQITTPDIPYNSTKTVVSDPAVQTTVSAFSKTKPASEAAVLTRKAFLPESLNSLRYIPFQNDSAPVKSPVLLALDVIANHPIKSKKIAISYEVGAGMMLVTKSLSANGFDDYVSRRNAEEQQALFSSWQLGMRFQIKRWSLGTGLELNQYGEKIRYDNWLNGINTTVNTNTAYNNDSLTIIQRYYVQGNEFDHPVTQYFTDTVYTNDTLSVAGKVPSDVSQVNSRTMLSYIEIPLSIQYNLVEKRRFTAGVQAGVSLGLLREKRGYYVDRQLSEFSNLKDSPDFRTVIFNARMGLDMRYYFHPATSVFIRPEFRTNLQSVFKSTTGIQQHYSAWGLTIGVSRSF